ncbi:four-helix bundle copper-binding protein [bacterium]|nr:four-helix bundle copper-binding protein [bacterium]
MSIENMLHTHPLYVEQDRRLVNTIDECFVCAAHCNVCADACLGEEHVAALRHCIELNQVCADLCQTTGRFLSRLTVNDNLLQEELLATCERACRLCADECEMHAQQHQHCKICAEACRRCAGACSAYRDHRVTGMSVGA